MPFADILTNLGKQVLHLELDLADSGIDYQPGDSLGVSPLNDDAMVDSLLTRLELDGGRLFEVVAAEDGSQQGLLPHLGCPCSLRTAFQRGVDITSPPRYRPGSTFRLDLDYRRMNSRRKTGITVQEVPFAATRRALQRPHGSAKLAPLELARR